MKRTAFLFLGVLMASSLALAGCEQPTDQTKGQASQKQKADDEADEQAEQKDRQADDEADEGKTEPDPEAMAMTKERQSEMTPEAALERLQEGNERFLRDGGLDRDLNAQVTETAGGQYPFAAVLGCIDSRVPPEIIFDQGIGDIFSARVAGNFVNDDMLGSLEFATKVAGAKAVVVLGHTSCGAVKGACDNVEMGHVSSLVKNIRPSVNEVMDEDETCSSEDTETVNEIAEANVERTIQQIRDESDVLKELEDDEEIAIVGAMYDVKTGEVEFY
jgi:carbonic anhydrase